MHEYDRIAAWYVVTRDPAVGAPEVAALARTLPPRADVLDAGCGDGVPVSRVLAASGAALTALDSSPEMLARYRARFPGVPARCERIQDATFPNASFDAVVAWGVWFHLGAAEQRAAIRRVAAWLRPGGRFLFTSGEAEGTRSGEMDGVAFRYVSLGAAGYERALAHAGLRLTDAHRDAFDNHVYLAERPG